MLQFRYVRFVLRRLSPCGRLHVRFAPFDVRWQKYNKIDRTTKLFAGYSVLNPQYLTFY